ncbi:MAG: metallophosphoesterase [Lachnospiraceae bacterium]|nr:metallophosphoesterase [Lachnospiraceae bacterium]
MRFLHCADLHLDSKLTANLDSKRARERKTELLNTFVKMVDYAARENVDVVLIAGDLFDTNKISVTAKSTVRAAVENHPDIKFLYLKGNHDNNDFISEEDEIPENLLMFDNTWKAYHFGNIDVYGIELDKDNSSVASDALVCDSSKFNIVMLHGQVEKSAVKDKAERINISGYKNKGVDYLALGHIHAYKKEALDARTTYCYPGCLEGRGFDECGEHGFVIVDVDENTGNYTHRFIPFAKRHLYELRVDVSDCNDSISMQNRVEECIKDAGIKSDDLIKIVLVGEVDVECEKDENLILSKFEDSFYFAKIVDETGVRVDIEDYLLDESLKGEFVRTVLSDESMDETERGEVIRIGLKALAGEEI